VKITHLIAALVILGCTAGCRRAPELRPRLILEGELVGKDFWLAAPHVVAVKIIHADLQGRREPIFRGGPRTLQLVKFTANVENVIKGDLPRKEIAFFFFAKVDQNPTYFLYPGKRYIVSLRSEGGVLRSWADASQLKIEVNSGAHNQADLPLDIGPEAAIAYILLTPGAGCDPVIFGNTLGWPDYGGDPGYVNQRLKQLRLNSNRFIRDSACLTAAMIFWHRPQCLEQCLDSPDSQLRRSAEAFLKTDDVNLPGLLRNPSSLFPAHCDTYMSQMLEIYAEDMRPEVRKSACALLRSFWPRQDFGQCK
jgi:hypothetical protein